MAAPADCGVKITENDLLCPAARVRGSARPLRENSPVLELAEVTTTLAVLALSVPVRLLLLPTVTLPKLRVAGERESWPELVPVPERATLRAGFEPFEARLNPLLIFPAD